MPTWIDLGPCGCCNQYPYYYSPYYPYSGGLPSIGTCCQTAALKNITITAADDPIRRWLTDQGYTFPASFTLPLDFSSVELCGGNIGSFNISAYCSGNIVCVNMSTSGSSGGSSGPDGYLLAGDCTTKLYNQCIKSCDTCASPFPPEGTGTVSFSNYVCDNSGNFIAVDIVIHTSIGDIHATISR